MTESGFWGMGSGEPSEPWHCKKCDGWFQTPDIPVSCTVYHLGGCCHYGDKSVDRPDHIRDFGVL